MLALDFVQAIAQHRQEIFVGRDDRTIEFELNHRLRFTDRIDLSGKIGILQRRFGDVGGEFHDLEGLAVVIENRVVGCLNPDLLAALADALVFAA